MGRASSLLGVVAAVGVLGAVAAACNSSDFDSPTKLESVRILATRAAPDESYAKPGDHVTLESLAIDARPIPAAPMVLYWIPYVCQNPKNDVYTSCFTAPAIGGAAGGDAGADAGQGSGAGSSGGVAGLLQPGTDLTPFLPTGPRYAFDVPADIITKHAPVAGVPPYGLVIVFNVACAGRVQVKAFDPSTGPQQVPLGCFDAAGHELSPNDYVIGFTRVYVYDQLRNANPAIAGIVVNGAETAATPDPTRPAGDPHDVPAPIDLTLPACHGNCEPAKVDVDVPGDSWEVNPASLNADGNPQHESIWVDYYAKGGTVDGEARLLYDANAGRISGTETKYSRPDEPGDATLYAVVHDSRLGVTWVQVNVHAN